MSKLVQKTRWTQLSGALNEVCDLVHSRKVASAGAIEDCKSQMEWYNVHRARPSPESYRPPTPFAVVSLQEENAKLRRELELLKGPAEMVDVRVRLTSAEMARAHARKIMSRDDRGYHTGVTSMWSSL